MTRGLCWVCLVVLAGMGLAWNLSRFPATWVDEGQHVAAAAALVRTGTYGAPNEGRVVAFDPAIQVGPAVIVPVAAAFFVGGVELATARLVMLVMATATLVLFALAAWRAGGHDAALIATLLLLVGNAEAFASFVYLSRQVIGEVAALGWVLAALLALPDRGTDRRHWRLALSGIFLGIGLTTKGQLVFIVLPALGLAWMIDRLWYRRWRWWQVPSMVAVAVACLALWHALQVVVLGWNTYAEHARVLRLGVSTQILACDPVFARRALGNLWRTGFLAFGVPAIAFAAWRSVRRDEMAVGQLPLLMVTVIAAGWLVTGSVGWSRYAFYPAALSTIWIATAVAWLARHPAVAIRRAAALGLVALVSIQAVAASTWWREMAAPRPDGFDEMRAWIQAQVSPEARIETWEWSFLMDPTPRWSHPDLEHMYAITAYVMRQQRPERPLVDPLQSRPDYVLQGPFGGWTGIYDGVLRRPGSVKVVQFHDYALYAVGRLDVSPARSDTR